MLAHDQEGFPIPTTLEHTGTALAGLGTCNEGALAGRGISNTSEIERGRRGADPSAIATCAACRQSWCGGPEDDEECVVFCDECRESMCRGELTDLYVDLGGGD
ncbi:MAG: hypothetical protein HYY06_24035 [Deltaproteobacteria bacterium]|nr:hypothetical protein [Deltaproteobacteria bacterium]